MITNMNQLIIGHKVYQKRKYSGIVEFEVAAVNKYSVQFISLSISGFGFEMSENDLDESLAVNHYLFNSYEEAQTYYRTEHEKNVTKIVEQYSKNLPEFIDEMIQQAYRANQNPEYGNSEEADAIQQVVAKHFPNVTL